MSNILGPTGVPWGGDEKRCSAGGCDVQPAWRLDGNPEIPVEHRMTLYFCESHYDAASRPLGARPIDA